MIRRFCGSVCGLVMLLLLGLPGATNTMSGGQRTTAKKMKYVTVGIYHINRLDKNKGKGKGKGKNILLNRIKAMTVYP